VDASNLDYFLFPAIWSANISTGTIYVSHASNFSGNANMEISLPNASNNRLVVKRSSLVGSPTWNAIRYFRVRIYAFAAAATDLWLDGLKMVLKTGKTITLRTGLGDQVSDFSSGVTYAGQETGEARTIEGIPCVYCKSNADTVGEIKLALNNMVDFTKTARISFKLWGLDGATLGQAVDVSYDAAHLGTYTVSRAAYPSGWQTINLHRSEFGGSFDWHRTKHFRWRVAKGGTGIKKEFAVADLRIYPNAKPMVVLSHDDEYDTLDTFVRPLVASYGWAGIAYIMHANIGAAGYCDEAAIQRLYDAGWDIGNHTMAHTNHASTDYATAYADFAPMQTYLISKKWVRRDCHLQACYPQGAYNATTLAALDALGVKTCTTVYDGTDAAETFASSGLTLNRYLTADKTIAQFKTRLNLAVARGENLILYTHGVDAGAAQALYTQQLAALWRMEREGLLEVKTLTEALAAA
jgi:peptidoglycan/xylan/chitin deacetylase (PgdA/CDA1 family)